MDDFVTRFKKNVKVMKKMCGSFRAKKTQVEPALKSKNKISGPEISNIVKHRPFQIGHRFD